jgi:hypothetical protein
VNAKATGLQKDEADADYLSRANRRAHSFMPPFDLMKAVSG